jgi:2-oxoisovalerate dehydrogenase E1 component
MAQIRAVEKRLVQSYQEGLIPGDCHSSLGQEAVATGICQHLRSNDLLFSPHRGHGHALGKGMPLAQLFGELYGRVTGCCQGKGGGRNLLSREIGLLGSSGLLGATITESVGAGIAIQLEKSDRVAVAFFGDGAALHGRFHEGVNLAVHWKLPILFVCENNLYSDQTKFEDLTAQTRVSLRGRAYGLHGVNVDGNDVMAIYEEAHEAVRSARAGDGPSLIECRTYRARPFVEGMEEKPARPPQERDEWLANDPIVNLAKKMLEAGHASGSDVAAVEEQVVQEVLQAHYRAKEAPFPKSESA